MDCHARVREFLEDPYVVWAGTEEKRPITERHMSLVQIHDHAELTANHRRAVLGSATRLTDLLRALDRTARREQRTVPTSSERVAVHACFWDDLVACLDSVGRSLFGDPREQLRGELHAILNPWFLRSRLWARSWLKPHGYAGEFRMLEWMYDLEHDPCADVTQPAVVNVLDDLFKSVHSVQAVWHRRRWFADVIINQLADRDSPVRVLDVACGGSRYVRDVMERHGDVVAATFVDQDPAALAFVRSWLPAASAARASIVCAPVRWLGEVLAEDADSGQFDVAVSTGLFDYLPADGGRVLLRQIAAHTRPGGTVAVCNFSPDDRSAAVKDWIADWQLLYRSRSEVAGLFPPDLEPTISQSPDGGLLYARATVVRRA
jgi:extracellular factor (EF) 3-hydroxypalmitic acid methyl ester biosynthesis protein